MRHAIIALGLTLSCANLQAQPVGVSAAIATLSSATKDNITWNVAKAKTADVTCSGHADTIIFGSDKKTVWVGVVSSGGGKPQILKFPIKRGVQDGFCAKPTAITLSSHSCIFEMEGQLLPDCKPAKTCRDFSVEDDDCDSFNFYWDSRHKIIRWWRN